MLCMVILVCVKCLLQIDEVMVDYPCDEDELQGPIEAQIAEGQVGIVGD